MTGSYEKKYVFYIIFITVSIIYIVRLLYIQILTDKYKLSAKNNVLRYITLYPNRGLIYDRNNKLLVYNEPAYDIMVIPRQIKSIDTSFFCRLFSISKESFNTKLKEAKKYSLYKPSIFIKQITAEKFAKVQEYMFMFKGFYSQPRPVRKYVINTAAHIFGYISEIDKNTLKKYPSYKQGDYIGYSGIEKSYENILKGKRGVKIVVVDVHNREKGSFKNGIYDTLPVPGKDLKLSISADLQIYGEKLMKNKKGSIVAIEPQSGEILALISSPSYDPNLLVGNERSKNYLKLLKDTLKPLFNRALMAKYPPGSTFKIANALIGQQEGVLSLNTLYTCNRGYHIRGISVACHSHPSPLNLTFSLRTSCNAYYCNVFRSIIEKYPNAETGFNKWRDYVVQFGFGKKLGIDLSSELNGFVPDAKYYDRFYGKGRWNAITILSLAIGQGELGITPLQMANYAAILANKGYYFIPHIVKEIKGQKIDKKYTSLHFVNINTEYFDIVRNAMQEVVEEPWGTAHIAKIDSITVCGKTGTAQNPHGKDHSIFIAFAPKDNPQIAIAVYVENAGFGSSWAAPIASLMIEKYLKHSIKRKELEKRILEGDLIYTKK